MNGLVLTAVEGSYFVRVVKLFGNEVMAVADLLILTVMKSLLCLNSLNMTLWFKALLRSTTISARSAGESVSLVISTGDSKKALSVAIYLKLLPSEKPSV